LSDFGFTVLVPIILPSDEVGTGFTVIGPSSFSLRGTRSSSVAFAPGLGNSRIGETDSGVTVSGPIVFPSGEVGTPLSDFGFTVTVPIVLPSEEVGTQLALNSQ
jgi:hypothetical protein